MPFEGKTSVLPPAESSVSRLVVVIFEHWAALEHLQDIYKTVIISLYVFSRNVTLRPLKRHDIQGQHLKRTQSLYILSWCLKSIFKNGEAKFVLCITGHQGIYCWKWYILIRGQMSHGAAGLGFDGHKPFFFSLLCNNLGWILWIWCSFASEMTLPVGSIQEK